MFYFVSVESSIYSSLFGYYYELSGFSLLSFVFLVVASFWAFCLSSSSYFALAAAAASSSFFLAAASSSYFAFSDAASAFAFSSAIYFFFRAAA